MITFNDSQILGLDLDKHIALDAGAGTGKTTVMAERYVQHLITPEQRSRILLPTGPRSHYKATALLEHLQQNEPKWRNGKDYYPAK